MTTYITNLENVLLYIKDRYGIKCFQNGMFINMLADLAPGLKREKSLLYKMYERGIVADIMTNKNNQPL